VAIADHTADPTIRDIAQTLFAAIRFECMLIDARCRIGRAVDDLPALPPPAGEAAA
jgi:hypothetical protein